MISSSCYFFFFFVAILTIDEPTTKKLCNEGFVDLVKILVDKLPIFNEFINLMAFGSFPATTYISYDSKCC